MILDQPVPEIPVITTGNRYKTFSELRGKNVVLYFYPKDNTPGCTAEGKDFAALHEQFLQENTVILGISRDNLALHEKFKQKYSFPFELISDSDGILCQHFDVIKMKSMFGKKYPGIERSTFLIDQEGVLRKEWRKVKVKGHADAVLAAVQKLQTA